MGHKEPPPPNDLFLMRGLHMDNIFVFETNVTVLRPVYFMILEFGAAIHSVQILVLI